MASTFDETARSGFTSAAIADSRRGLTVVAALTVASFGPYLAGGIRTEQMAVYATAAVVVILTLPLLKAGRQITVVLAAWAAYLAVTFLGAFWPPPNRSPYPWGSSIVAGLDNAALPLAVLLTVLGLTALGAEPKAMLRRVAGWTVLLMCFNTVAALMQFKSNYDWTAWYGGDDNIQSVSFRAAQLGRFGGIFNQPAEAGVLYSVAGICAIYLLGRRPILLTLALAGLTLGGILTVSKVFVLAGLPLMVVGLLRGSRGRGARLGATAMVGLGAWVAIGTGLFAAWSGIDFLKRNLIPTGNSGLLQTLTADRYGGAVSAGGGSLHGVTTAVLSGPMWGGYGARGLYVAYDSGWVEALVTAGLIGVVAQAVVFVAIARAWATMRRCPERTLLGMLTLVLLAGSLGLPTLTANRVATIVWLLLACTLALARRWNASEGQDGGDRSAGIRAISAVIAEDAPDEVPMAGPANVGT